MTLLIIFLLLNSITSLTVPINSFYLSLVQKEAHSDAANQYYLEWWSTDWWWSANHQLLVINKSTTVQVAWDASGIKYGIGLWHMGWEEMVDASHQIVWEGPPLAAFPHECSHMVDITPDQTWSQWCCVPNSYLPGHGPIYYLPHLCEAAWVISCCCLVHR